MKKLELLLLLTIVLGAFFVRLYRIDNPIADWHSWRQSDTSAVTRNFVKNGIDLLHPRFDDLSNIPSGKDNPQGYRFVEFPLYNAAAAGMFNIFNKFSIETWGRLATIFSSLLSITFLFLLVKKYLGLRVGLLTAFFFGFLPYNIYYSRTILPDPSMVMSILGGTYFFDKWIDKNSKLQLKSLIFYGLSVIFVTCAFLIKPFALFFTLPMLYLAFRKWGMRALINPQLWLFAILTLTPLILWRHWIQQFPEGIPVSNWLFNENNIRFKGAFFYWLFADRIGRLILGYWGVALLVLGLLRKQTEKEGWFFITFVISSLLYLVVMAGGNVKHDYYQILIIPTLAIFLAKGADLLLNASKEYFSRVICYLLFVICCLATLGFSWYHVRDYFNINNPKIITNGKIVDAFVPKEAKVIALYGGDTAFLYQTNRQGWPSLTHTLPEMIKRGATHLAILSPDNYWRQLTIGDKVLYRSDEFLLVELKK